MTSNSEGPNESTATKAEERNPTHPPDAAAATEVALVLGAGGSAAEAWHAGVTRALHEATGWDARSAELIVGTSAGGITGLGLRAGIPPSDLYALKKGWACSSEGREILDRIVTEHSEGRRDRSGQAWGAEWIPQSPVLTARSLWPPWQPRPVHAAVGMMPSGVRTTDALEQWLSEMHPGPWPTQRFWVPVVRLDDGCRVVLGRDDVQTTAARAVRASCAVPALHEPVTVCGSRYVDGAIHSATNADLAGPPDFDAVLVSSVMSGTASWPKVRKGLRTALSDVKSAFEEGTLAHSGDGPAWWNEAWSHAWNSGLAVRAARRQRMASVLRNEVDAIRRRGTAVLVIEPDAAAVELLDSCNTTATSDIAEIAALADAATRKQLPHPPRRPFLRIAEPSRRRESGVGSQFPASQPPAIAQDYRVRSCRGETSEPLVLDGTPSGIRLRASADRRVTHCCGPANQLLSADALNPSGIKRTRRSDRR